MSTTTCPECGMPLRPGARFCGNCGATLPASPAPRGESAQPALDGPVCPHCGNLIRAEARFCNSCGKPLGITAAETLPQAAVSPAQLEDVPAATTPQPVLAPPAAPAVKPAETGPAKKPKRQGLLWLILPVVIVGCGLAAVAGYFAARQLGWLARETPLVALPATPVEAPASAAPTLASLADTPVAAASPTRLAPTQTTSTPTTAPAQTATQDALATEPVSSTETLLAPPPAGVVLFEDSFDAGLRENWLTWGEPRATISAGFGDNWLNLKALDPGQAGVTTRPEFVIPNEPGVTIEFDAEMDERYPQAVLILDWDPAAFDRGPVNQEPGFIRLEIRADKLTLSGRSIEETCEQPNTGADGHIYLLRLTEGQGVALYLDGAGQPVCQIASMNLDPQPGKISFSGLGWVSRVKVILAE
jgi:hypothetical protein